MKREKVETVSTTLVEVTHDECSLMYIDYLTDTETSINLKATT